MIKNYLSLFSKLALSVAIVAATLSTAKATTYTAIASGNFSSSATWFAGTAPVGLIAGDQIIIPSGLIVTLDNNVTFNAAATLNVDGMLQSGMNNSAIIMTAGTISGNGSIDVDSMSLALVSGVTFTGDIVADHMSTWISTFNSTADVTVNNSLWVMAGLLNIMDGTFTMGSNSTIHIDGGTIALGGTGAISLTSDYNVVYEGSSSSTGIELTGSGLQDVTVDLSSGSVTLTSDVVLDGTLDLENGNLILNGNDLTLEANADIDATGNGTINSDANANITINTSGSLTGDLTFGNGNNTVNNFTLNLGNSSANADLGSDIVVNGTITLTQGTMSLNNNDLTFAGNGNFSASGTGTIVSSSNSDITITSNNNFTGGIRFASTGNTVNDLTIDLGSNNSYASLGSDLHVAGTLMLSTGMMHVWDNDLIINAGGMVAGGSENSYVITEEGGHLTINLAANASEMFHVGTMNNYAPAVVAGNTGTVTSDISVMVDANVYGNGTTGSDLSNTQSVVDGTWFITSSASTGLDLNLQLMWDASMEVNGFDRTNSYISHYTNNMWDVTAGASAVASGNMYVMNRNNVTTLSPFTVADNDATLDVMNTVANNVAITVYPNPATEMVNFTSDKQVTDIVVYDVTGRVVKAMSAQGNSFSVSDLTAGNYTIQLSGADFKATQQLIKN